MAIETAPRHPCGAQTQIREPDRVIGEIAELQYGVVARRQLLAAGLGRRLIAARLKAGRLHRIHPGIYAVGHRALSRGGRWMAAVLAGGEGTVLSHRSAAVLWGLRKDAAGLLEITTPRSTRSFRSLRRHCAYLPVDEMTLRHRIPVTTVPRTLLDLAAMMAPADFERALREAEVLRLPERPPLSELLARYPGRRGTRTVRVALERLERLSGTTRSHLEDRFLRFAERSGLPAPETNVTLTLGRHRYEADCVWHKPQLIVELDGHQAHGTRAAFEHDRERDRRLQAAGWTVVRATSRQLDEATDLAADIRALLAQPTGESA